jgi:hypothetical protein
MDIAEYKRREKFLNDLKQLCESEYLEILRVLIDKKVHFSENNNGIFFDVCSLEQSIFDKLAAFIEFSNKNRVALLDREKTLNIFKSEVNNTFKQEPTN